MSDRPSILYLHCHDAGRYVRPFGYDIPTPNIQRLAEEGILFRKAFCAAPSCSPSRAALVTGQYPHCCGMYGLASSRWGYTLNDYSQHLAYTLNQNGYETALSGVQHVARLPWATPHEMGYERLLSFDSGDTHDLDATVPAAVAYLKEDHRRPFFLSVGFTAPHRYGAGDHHTFTREIPTEPKDLDARYCLPMPHLPDNPIARRDMANYQQGAAVMDRQMGEVLDALEDNGLADDTLVICTTDHGPGVPDMKCTLTDRGVGVFLVMRGPGGFEGGKVIDGMVSHMDLYPTLMELLDIEPPSWLQGGSIMPLVRGEADEVHDEIIVEQSYHGNYRPLRAVRTPRFKYVRRFDLDQAKGVDGGPVHEWWVDQGWLEIPWAEEELYDLAFDPHESNNLIDGPRHAEVARDLRRRLDAWMRETDDPLLTEEGIPTPPAWK